VKHLDFTVIGKVPLYEGPSAGRQPRTIHFSGKFCRKACKASSHRASILLSPVVTASRIASAAACRQVLGVDRLQRAQPLSKMLRSTTPASRRRTNRKVGGRVGLSPSFHSTWKRWETRMAGRRTQLCNLQWLARPLAHRFYGRSPMVLGANCS
jgi:hypothetical protein